MKKIGIFFVTFFFCVLNISSWRKTMYVFPAGMYVPSMISSGRKKYAKKEKRKAIINTVADKATHFLRGQKFVNQRRFN
ncbi:MAG: hypothetical protein HFJ36_00995 [Clostridia bacterium]|nr:hypothetical protein [Clostridia bacterium]